MTEAHQTAPGAPLALQEIKWYLRSLPFILGLTALVLLAAPWLMSLFFYLGGLVLSYHAVVECLNLPETRRSHGS